MAPLTCYIDTWLAVLSGDFYSQLNENCLLTCERLNSFIKYIYTFNRDLRSDYFRNTFRQIRGMSFLRVQAFLFGWNNFFSRRVGISPDIFFCAVHENGDAENRPSFGFEASGGAIRCIEPRRA